MAGDIGVRRTEMAAIERAFDRVEQGHCSVVSIDGQAGIGKSYLLASGAQAAADRGAMVLRVGLTEVERMLAWAGLSVLLRRIDEWQPDGFPEARRAVLDRARQATMVGSVRAEEVASSVSELITQVTRKQPLVLVVDDIQWLDRESAAVLAFAIRANAHQRLLVLVAHRTGETASFELGRLDVTEPVDLSLRGLAVAGIRLLLRQAGHDTVRRQELVEIHALSEGNPFLALELARRLQSGERLIDLAVAAARSMYAVQLDDLSAAELEVARTCALIAHPTIETVRALFGVAVDDALIALQRKLVIVVDQGSISFTHPLRRHAVLLGWGELERRRLHARIGAVVDDPEQALLHLSEAADRPDGELAAAIEASATDAAAIGALEVAAQRFLRAALLTPEQDERGRWRRRQQSVHCSVMLGDIADVAEPTAELFASASTPDDVVVATIDLMEVRRLSTGIASAIQVVNAGLERLPSDSIRRVPLLERLVRIREAVLQ